MTKVLLHVLFVNCSGSCSGGGCFMFLADVGMFITPEKESPNHLRVRRTFVSSDCSPEGSLSTGGAG